MTAELANKVNILCQKVKKLSSGGKKEYLFANVQDFSSQNFIAVAANDPIPYDTILNSSCIKLNASGGAVINSSGVYNISYVVTTVSGADATVAVAVNGNVQVGTCVGKNDSSDTQTPIANSVVLELEANDIVTIINKTRSGTVAIILAKADFSSPPNTYDTNLSIHKI